MYTADVACRSTRIVESTLRRVAAGQATELLPAEQASALALGRRDIWGLIRGDPERAAVAAPYMVALSPPSHGREAGVHCAARVSEFGLLHRQLQAGCPALLTQRHDSDPGRSRYWGGVAQADGFGLYMDDAQHKAEVWATIQAQPCIALDRIVFVNGDSCTASAAAVISGEEAIVDYGRQELERLLGRVGIASESLSSTDERTGLYEDLSDAVEALWGTSVPLRRLPEALLRDVQDGLLHEVICRSGIEKPSMLLRRMLENVRRLHIPEDRKAADVYVQEAIEGCSLSASALAWLLSP